jgi:hypothetical protein
MVVDVDQTGNASELRQIDALGSRGRGASDGRNQGSVDDDYRVGNEFAPAGIEELAALNGGGCRKGVAQDRDQGRKAHRLLLETYQYAMVDARSQAVLEPECSNSR